MNTVTGLRGLLAAATIAFAVAPATAQDGSASTTADDVRAEISEAVDAIARYSEHQREQALAEARDVLTRIDAQVERREQALREDWATMSDSARETARARLRDLREARNTLGERYGAAQAGTSSAWEELKDGFSNAWEAFSEEWTKADDGNSVQ